MTREQYRIELQCSCGACIRLLGIHDDYSSRGFAEPVALASFIADHRANALELAEGVNHTLNWRHVYL